MASKGKRKPNIRDISRQPPTDEERKAVREAMANAEAPIVSAILGAALLEHSLEELLRPRFKRTDNSTWGRLTEENGPLGTFAKKIIAAYAFGIIDDVAKEGLETVKNIRNQFAHAKKLIDFSHELIVKELQGVKLPAQKRSQLYKWLASVKTGPNPRGNFILLCLYLYIILLEKGTASAKRKAKRIARKKGQSPINWLEVLRGGQPAGLVGGLAGLYGVDPKAPIGLSGGLLDPETWPPKSSGNEDK